MMTQPDNSAPRAAATEKRLLVMAGGTGGHVFPALAVAKRLQQQGWTVLWLGTRERMEAELVPRHGLPIRFIDIQGVRGNGLWRLLKAPFQLLRAVWQARRVIREFRPDVVMGMGGFASGPGGVAAWLSGKPLLLHEQNAVAGMTNKYLAKIANSVMAAFDGAFPPSSKLQIVGNPVRAELLALADRHPVANDGHSHPLRLLVVGGSLGARILNQTLPAAIAGMESAVEVRHQAGKGNAAEVEAAYDAAGVAAVTASDFIHDMAEAYAWADIVVCRAGALTVSEVAVVGLPAVFVPLPYAVDDHQTRNAEFLVNAGAAKLLPQSELTATRLAQLLDQLNNPHALQLMSTAALTVASRNADEIVADECRRLAG